MMEEVSDAENPTTTDDGSDIAKFLARKQKDVWRTPPELYEPIAERVGGFDLDPCAGLGADKLELPGGDDPHPDLEPTDIADRNVTLPTNGLEIEWNAEDVFLNFPFSEKPQWLGKAVREWQEGNADRIFIVTPDSTDTASWWHKFLAEHASVTFFHKSRCNFIDPVTGEQKSGVSFNTAISVLGEPPEELIEYWREEGDLVVRPWNEGWSHPASRFE